MGRLGVPSGAREFAQGGAEERQRDAQADQFELEQPERAVGEQAKQERRQVYDDPRGGHFHPEASSEGKGQHARCAEKHPDNNAFRCILVSKGIAEQRRCSEEYPPTIGRFTIGRTTKSR